MGIGYDIDKHVIRYLSSPEINLAKTLLLVLLILKQSEKDKPIRGEQDAQ